MCVHGKKSKHLDKGNSFMLQTRRRVSSASPESLGGRQEVRRGKLTASAGTQHMPHDVGWFWNVLPTLGPAVPLTAPARIWEF